jgi:UDP:flavonoid glycosyltransferase YjiC (YdhE family)
MNILLVNRGSQGDLYPYIALAQALQDRGHNVTYSAPRLFERELKEAGINYFLQAHDDIGGMLRDEPDTGNLLQWTARVIESQFKELIPLLEQNEILVAGNTEFAAPSIAEYCGKPLVRTAFGPFLPAQRIQPPVMPLPPSVIPPALIWGALNMGLNLMVLKPLNRNRKKLGLKPIKDQGKHAPENADNFLMYSRYLGNTDPVWNARYRWQIGGYCFNDGFPYDTKLLNDFISFTAKDKRPTVFFTLGSCNASRWNEFAEALLAICRRSNYKLAVSCGWWRTGSQLRGAENLFLMNTTIPHYLVFPHVDAIIHHGGAGTTHSAARAGKPQLIVPLLLDQFYWGTRVQDLCIGPGSVNIKKFTETRLEELVRGLVQNETYRRNAHALAEQMRTEHGLDAVCRHIESYGAAAPAIAVNQ